MSVRHVTSNARTRRHMRVRARVIGSATRPRLAVFRSNHATYAQLIDDQTGKTLAQANSREIVKKITKTAKAGEVGGLIAERAKSLKITTIVFDRGGYQYHGRVKALAEQARAAGLVF